MTASVIVVGSVNVDLTTQVRTLPSPGETVIGGTFNQASGGKGGNQAAAAAELGARTWIVGMVGDDDFGDSSRRDLRDSGVDVSELRTGRGHTGVAGIMVDERGENLIAVASGANDELGADMVVASLDKLAGAGAVVLADLEVPDEAVRAAGRWAAANDCAFVLNPAPARPLTDELVRLCAVLTPNEHEAQTLAAGGAEELLDRGASAVVVTKGAAGADLLRPGAQPHRQSAFPVSAVDTTGAGDAFSAALAWALASGRGLEVAVESAAAAGALATRALGARAGFADASEVERMLRR